MTTSEPPIGLRENRNWRRLWSGQAVSVVGDFVFNTTVVLWIATVLAAGQSWAAAAVAGALIAAAAPILVVGPMAGVFVDRWDRRRIMMAADLIRAGLIGLLLVVSLLGDHWPVWLRLSLVYITVALASSTAQFFNPARFSVIATTVAKDDQPRAFGLLAATSSTAAVIGPPLAAPLLFTAGVHWALLINAASYLVSFVAIKAIRVPGTEKPEALQGAGFLPELREGLSFFIRNRPLVVIAAAVCVFMFGVGSINVLAVFFVTDNLLADAGWLGTLTAGFGLGSILGALLTSRLTKWLGETRVFTLGLAATGLIVLVYSRQTHLVAAIITLALAGIPLAAVNTVLGPLVLRTTPKHLLGRINSVLNPLVYLASITSMALAGFLASSVLRDLNVDVAGMALSRIDAIFGFAALMMIIAGIVAIRPLSTITNQSDPARQTAAAGTAPEET